MPSAPPCSIHCTELGCTVPYAIRSCKGDDRIRRGRRTGAEPAAALAGPEAPIRGPRPGLTVDRIVTAAIELADAEGLGALSMRRVAERLGVGTMSSTPTCPAKPSCSTSCWTRSWPRWAWPDGAGSWRAGLELRARQDWALFHRHPWMPRSPSRALLGPNETELFEATLRVADGIGLGGRRCPSSAWSPTTPGAADLGARRGRRGRAAHRHLRRAVVGRPASPVRQVL